MRSQRKAPSRAIGDAEHLSFGYIVPVKLQVLLTELVE